MEEEIQQPKEYQQPQHNNSPHHAIDEIPQNFPTTTILTPLIYDPLLIQHPLFSHENDPILSILTSTTKAIINQNPDPTVLKSHLNNWISHLLAIIFNNADLNSLKEEFQRLGLSFDTICGRFIGTDQIYFRCLDCDRFKDTTSSIYALLCSQCFENSNHVGHRVLMVKKDSNTSATCDCGDHTAFDPAGFCRDHQPKEYCINETLSKFPQNFLNKYTIILKNVFYGILSLFEISFAANEKIKDALLALAQLTLEGTLIFCQICSEQINEAFLIVFGQVLQSSFFYNYSQLWHNCHDFLAEKGVKSVDSTNPHQCSCTIAGNLLRIGNISEHEIQSKLNKFLVECTKEPKFKVFFVREFTKYLPFLYSETYSNDDFDDNTNSKLLNMKAQLYGSDDLCFEVLNSGHFSNFIEVMKKTIHNAYQANHEVYHTTSDVRSALIYFLNNKTKASEMLIKNTPLLNQVLEVVMNFQMKFTYEGQFHIGLFDHQVDYKCINRGLMIEKVISQILDQGLKLIAEFDSVEEKELLFQQFGREWLGCFETTKVLLDEEQRKGVPSFHPALERIFVTLVRTYGQQFPNNSNVFEAILPGVDPAKLAQRSVEGCLRSLGMIRFVHLAHNLNQGRIWQVYYFSNNLFFEMDILNIQTMAAEINPEILLETLVDNYFVYDKDLREFFRTPQSLNQSDERLKQKLLVLQDFFNLIIFLMNDETCDLSSKICKDIHLASEETQLSTKCHRVIEKILVNLLLGQYWVDVPQLKESMKSIVIQHSDTDDILHKVAVFDEKNKKIRIKDDYKNELDPYIFYRNPALQNEINHNVASKAKKEEKVDLVSGKFYKDLPANLKAIQRRMFQSNLPGYLRAFLFNFEKHTAPLVRPVLKLILTNLQVAEETAKDCETVKRKVQESYLNQEFINRLAAISQDADFADCQLCIEKIQKLIQALSSNSQSLDHEVKETSQEDHATMKKKLAHQRMQQLKEEFAKKQKMFFHKNNHHIQQEEGGSMSQEVTATKQGDIMEDEDHEITCKFCLDKINKGVDAYGIPVYVAFTNNLRDIEDENRTGQKSETPEKLEGEWWPVISSCMHHYHQKCFQSHFGNSRKINDNMAKLFANNYEFCCSLCNTLCNAFMVEEDSKDNNAQQNPSQEGDNSGQGQTLSFPETVGEILKSLRTKLKLQKNESMEEEYQVHIEEIFRRGYVYFLESFHQIEKVAHFEKMVKIFQLFIRKFSKYLWKKNTQTESTEKSSLSFLTSVFSSSQQNKPLFGEEHESTEKKIALFSKYKAEPLLNSLSLELAMQLVRAQGEGNHLRFDVLGEQAKILKEYVAFKIIQLVLYCKEPEPVSLRELYQLYKEDEELREDVLDELLFPLQKLTLATALNNSLNKGEDKVDEKLLDFLLNPEEENISHYLDKLVKCVGFGESLDKIIEESLGEILNKEVPLVQFFEQLLSCDTSGMTLTEPRSIKLASQMIELPKNYLDFISVYLKKKCSLCQEYSQHMSTAICLICGDVLCLAYCSNTPQKRGNLNLHAKQCHMGSSMFVEIQRLSKSVVGCAKNIIYAGKDIYRDKLGHSIHSLLNDPRCLLYSLEFDKFALNEDFVKEAKEVIEQNNMTKEVYKITRASGYYYAEGNL